MMSMSKLSNDDARTLQKLIEKYGLEEIARVEKPDRNKGGRPTDPRRFNEPIIAGHVEFLKLHRVSVKTKKVDAACAELAAILKRYTPVARGRKAGTIRKIYNTVRKAARKDALTLSVMNSTYAVLASELADHPDKVGIPYLVEGSANGEKFPIVDTLGCINVAPIVHDGDGFRACLTIIATPNEI
jgi:hypothetical protein